MKRRNNAFVKFDSLYPNDKILLIDLINHVRTEKGCPLVQRKEQEEISTDLTNKRKIRYRVKFKDEERLCREKRKSRKI